MKPLTDCLYFLGEKPCGVYEVCNKNCPHYRPIAKSFLIIKLGALGDVLRTTPVLTFLKKRHSGASVTWLTRPSALPLLASSSIDELLSFTWQNWLILHARHFDCVLSFDKEPSAIALAASIKADKKCGFLMNRFGKLDIANAESEYALRLGVDDELKFRTNRLSYQDIVFQMMGERFQGEEYVMPTVDEEKAEKLKKRYYIHPSQKIVGINVGCGDKFLTKEWGLESYRKLINILLEEEQSLRPFILAGPDESRLHQQLYNEFYDTPCIFSGTTNTLSQFMGLVSLCNLVVSNDSLTMHIAIGLKKQVITLFGSTAPWEIDLYGRGVKLFSERSCSPCYQHSCPSLQCMKDITPGMVWKAIQDQLQG